MVQDAQRQARVANGMPTFGIGTWQNDDPDECAASVQTALDMGYRHVDTAQSYRNESAVGRGIAEASVPRDDVFLATKVWTDNLEPEQVHSSTADSLDRLDTDYLDLLYVHWPANEYQAEETLSAFAELRSEGTIERIGVSNFQPRHLDEAADVLGEQPFANQVEFNPLLPQEELREYADEHDVQLVGYSPLARGEVFDVPEIQDVAEKHDASEAQVSLAWIREKDVTTIPKATSEDHIEENWASLDLELDDEDVAKIDGIDRRSRQVDPDFAPWN